jgi:hypothetical protein
METRYAMCMYGILAVAIVYDTQLQTDNTISDAYTPCVFFCLNDLKFVQRRPIRSRRHASYIEHLF